MTPRSRRWTAALTLILVRVAASHVNALEEEDLRITEFLAVGGGGLLDEDGDRSDWIEVHNPGSAAVSLEGWSLTDRSADLMRWSFPAVELPAGGYVVVFASGKDRADPRAGTGVGDEPELHTNFKLSGDGEYLALVAPDERVADEYSPEYPPQSAGISYGVESGGRRRYFPTPTPGMGNHSLAVSGFVADTKFSVDRGFYEEPVMVEITTETPDAAIRFTLDGSEPTATHGEVYSGAILVDRTTTLRAAAFRPDLQPTSVDTHTYIFLEDVVAQDHEATLAAGFPSTWGETLPDYGLAPDIVAPDGADRYGGRYAATMRDDLRAVPTLSIVLDIDDLFGADGIYTHATKRGVDWERPASVELIHPDGRPGFELRCGLRVHGGAFRNHLITKKHSLRLLFKGIYGQTKLRFPWFGDDAADEFDTIVLRAGSNDGWQWQGADSRPLYVRDAFAHATLRAMGGLASRGDFAHVYINGIYWGLYNAVERPDASFSATYHGGDKDDWDAISSGEVSSGNLDAWNRMVALATAGLSDDASYQHIQGRAPDGSDDPTLERYLDVPGFADYMITNLYVGNTDWPRKNYWVARNRRASETDPPSDAGFRFYTWDAEWSMGIRSDLNTDRITVTDGVAVAWPHLRENAEFRVLFGDHVHRHFSRGGALYVDPSRPFWDPGNPARNTPAARFWELCEIVDRAVVPESARWGDQHRIPSYTRDEHWQLERDNLLSNYFPYRSSVVLAQLRSSGLYPGVDAPELDPSGARFVSSQQVEITVPAGAVYYTLDGTDPRLPGGAISPRAFEIPARRTTPIVLPGALARVLVPLDGSLGLEWTRLEFDDTEWALGETAVGYERSSGFEHLIRTDVEESLYGRGSSVYLRIPFILESLESMLPTLAVMYDDGFVAYLNGERILVANAPDVPRWDSLALGLRPDSRARQYQEFDLSEQADLLRNGLNVLAIHGMNHTTTSADLLLLPRLELREPRTTRETTLSETTVMKARAWVDGEWSALTAAAFVETSLRITEIMFHPADPDRAGGDDPYEPDDYEFVELANIGDSAVNLTGARLAGGIEFDFSTGGIQSIAPGELVLVVRNRSAFASLYADHDDLLIAGEYQGNLSNSGEVLRLEAIFDTTLLRVAYDDDWQPAADGGGHSLVIADAWEDAISWSDPSRWMASAHPAGSPGTDEGTAPRLTGWQQVGDVNQDGRVDISDVVALLRALFGDGLPATLPCAGDAPNAGGNLVVLDWNRDRAIDLSDVVSLLGSFFRESSSVEREGCVRVHGCASICRP